MEKGITTPAFDFKEVDQEGLETLEAISKANHFNEWMYQTIRPHLSGHILEVGSGIGNISRLFLRDGHRITLSDVRDNYCQALERAFANEANLDGILHLDLVHADFEQQYAPHIGTFDSVFALNVVEHIENDALAIANTMRLLKPGGRMVILVPAYQWLYNRFDKELYHYRRYTARSLGALYRQNGLRVDKTFYFNTVGMAGWFYSGRVLNKKTIPRGQMSLYNKLVPVFKVIDKLVLNKTGLSVVAFGSKA
jgi:SAM-dependent methyltransferase